MRISSVVLHLSEIYRIMGILINAKFKKYFINNNENRIGCHIKITYMNFIKMKHLINPIKILLDLTKKQQVKYGISFCYQ